MSRSLWAAAGACALALATMPSVALANGTDGSSHPRGGETPAAATAASGRRHPHNSENRAERRRRRPATRFGHRGGYLLVLGTGYQQAGGSSRVRSLQRRLAHLGFAPGPIDGRYGPLTMGSVERFQATADLTVDGIAGPHTLTALNATRRAVLSPGAGYRLPDGSARVRSLQRRLAHLGFAPGPIDGRYGPLTTSAVRRFQQDRHLPLTGVAGLRTLVALRTTRHHRPPQVAPAPPPSTPLAPTPPRVARPVQPGPALPVVPVLLALGLLGLATLVHSYRKTRRQVRTASSSPPADDARTSPRTGPEPRRARDHVPAEPSRNSANHTTHDPTHTKCTTQNPASSPVRITNRGGALQYNVTPLSEAIALPGPRWWRLPTWLSTIQPRALAASPPVWSQLRDRLRRRRRAPQGTPLGGAGAQRRRAQPALRAFLGHRGRSGR